VISWLKAEEYRRDFVDDVLKGVSLAREIGARAAFESPGRLRGSGLRRGSGVLQIAHHI
jgi:hypothetical protein